MTRENKEREPAHHSRLGSSSSVQPGRTDESLWASREKEMARRKDPGWLQIIFDQTRDDKNRTLNRDEVRIGGLTPERAEAVTDMLIERARISDKINDPRHEERLPVGGKLYIGAFVTAAEATINTGAQEALTEGAA